MQLENAASRGSGFIISGGRSIPPKKRVQGRSAPQLAPAAGHVLDSAGAAVCEYSHGASVLTRALLRRALSLSAAVLSLALFFRFFTFGEGVYSGKNRIAVMPSYSEYKKAAKAAEKLASASGETFSRENCFTVPVISFRKNVCKKADAAQRLLLSSDKFSEAYTLISEDKAVYNAKTKKEAEHVLSEYIKRLSVGSRAKLSSSVQIVKRIISSKDVMSKEDCAYLLDHSGLVTVVSVADSSYEKNIPFGTETEADSNMYLGETVTLSEGSEGRAEVLRRTVYKNGIAEDVSIISEDVSVQPVARIIKVGTKQKDVLKTGVFMPLSGRLSSPFGPRWGRMHEGIDIAVPEGTPVKAAECGKVSFVSENAGGYGKLVRIDHGYGVQTAYGHLSKITAAEGDTVAAGAEIALSGNTGNSTGPHLHFEIIKDGEQIDPAPYIKK